MKRGKPDVKRVIFCLLMFLPLLAVLIALPFLPDEIPAHYGFSGQVDRWGSKYETLYFPVLTLLFGFFMLGMARVSAKQEKDGKNNETICLVTGIVCLALFNGMTGYFLYTDFQMVEDLSQVPLEFNRFICLFLGIVMVVVGNILPKARLNSLLGLRTPWSMANETTWKKSQRFGGLSCIIGGLAMMGVCFWVKGLPCLLYAGGIFTLILVVDVLYTYRIYKKYGTPKA